MSGSRRLTLVISLREIYLVITNYNSEKLFYSDYKTIHFVFQVRAAVARPPRRALDAGLLPGDHRQAHGAQVRQRRLRLSQVHPPLKSRCCDLHITLHSRK